MLYLDVNVFIYASINTEELREKAEALLAKVQNGDEKAKTSVITFDEVFWAIKKHDLKLAFQACETLLNFSNLDYPSG